jgi:hypothetical protein
MLWRIRGISGHDIRVWVAAKVPHRSETKVRLFAQIPTSLVGAGDLTTEYLGRTVRIPSLEIQVAVNLTDAYSLFMTVAQMVGVVVLLLGAAHVIFKVFEFVGRLNEKTYDLGPHFEGHKDKRRSSRKSR